LYLLDIFWLLLDQHDQSQSGVSNPAHAHRVLVFGTRSALLSFFFLFYKHLPKHHLTFTAISILNSRMLSFLEHTLAEEFSIRVSWKGKTKSIQERTTKEQDERK
jgi:hypothetical protein